MEASTIVLLGEMGVIRAGIVRRAETPGSRGGIGLVAFTAMGRGSATVFC